MAATHRIYAQAFYDALSDRGDAARAREELADFAEAVRAVPELRQLLANPLLDPATKRDALESLLGDADPFVRNFLLLLAEKGRAGEVEHIHQEFEKLVAAAEGRLDVELTTAHELDDVEFGRIVGQIERSSGRRVTATRRVDPDLIGGIVLQAGSLRLDASVRGRLNRLRQELATR